jgi:nucleoside-triphosphatase
VKKHLFLTGEIQIGKSTLIAKYREYLNGKKHWSGFRTCPYIEDGVHSGFQMIGANENPRVRDAHIVGIKDEDASRFKGICEVFDTYGVELLKEAREHEEDMVIMDELGFFELNAIKFREAVHSVLDGNQRTLGVIKIKTNPFLEEVKQREDVLVMEINIDNRDEMLHKIIEFFSDELL